LDGPTGVHYYGPRHNELAAQAWTEKTYSGGNVNSGYFGLFSPDPGEPRPAPAIFLGRESSNCLRAGYTNRSAETPKKSASFLAWVRLIARLPLTTSEMYPRDLNSGSKSACLSFP
jgi:hypothetical protein